MQGYKTLLHPDRYIWDFWYYYDSSSKFFHLFYLNADPKTIPGEKFHNAAEIGYAVTKDFVSIDWGPHNVLSAESKEWYNSSMWSGDIIKITDGFLLFFTSREKNVDDGFTQNIGAAYSENIAASKWKVVQDIRIKPDPSIYEPKTLKDDVSIHAWRDPYLFIYDEQIHMLVSAKAKKSPLGKNGTIALLRSKDGGFIDWEILSPIAQPNSFSEMEVSQLFLNSNRHYELVFSSSFKATEESIKNKIGGLYTITSSNLKNFNNVPQQLLPLKSDLYACRIIPELGGEIIGFDTQTGGIRRSGIKTGFSHVNRNFTKYKLTQ